MTPILQQEINKYLKNKTVYYNNFSSELVEYLNSCYPTLPTIKSQWYMLKMGITQLPQCQYNDCKNQARWNERKQLFDKGCCKTHSQKITFINNFGVEHPNQNKKQQDKVKKSIQKKYGVDYITQTPQHKHSVKSTNREKYGVDSVLKLKEIRKKIQSTNLEKYGVKEVLANKEIRKKAQDTIKYRYGVDSILSSSTVRSKVNKTNLERYGSIFPMRNNELQQKRLNTVLEIYGGYSHLSDPENLKKFKEKHFKDYYTNKIMNNNFVNPLFDLNQYIGTVDNNKRGILYRWECKECNHTFEDYLAAGHMPSCPQCYPKDWRKSKGETELFEMLDYTNKESSDRKVIGKEIDIYLPDYNLGIEFNGMYWHSEQKGKHKYYHFDKTITAENNGVRLIHIFDDEWKNNKKIILGIIDRITNRAKTLNLEDVCIVEIDRTTFDDFAAEYSLQQKDEFTRVAYGCYYDTELVAVLNFSKLRNKDSLELRKFIEKPKYKISSHIVKMLIDTYLPKKEIYYFADRRFNSYLDNEYFENMGFSFEGVTEPIEYYYKNGILTTTSTVHQHLENYIQVEKMDSQLTIKENLEIQGYLSIWDCGKLVYKKY